jgi:hypothetical protein
MKKWAILYSTVVVEAVNHKSFRKVTEEGSIMSEQQDPPKLQNYCPISKGM